MYSTISSWTLVGKLCCRRTVLWTCLAIRYTSFISYWYPFCPGHDLVFRVTGFDRNNSRVSSRYPNRCCCLIDRIVTRLMLKERWILLYTFHRMLHFCEILQPSTQISRSELHLLLNSLCMLCRPPSSSGKPLKILLESP
jgi:hypothetical protein